MHINRPIFRTAGVLVTAATALTLAAGCGDNPDQGAHTPGHPAASAPGSPTAAAAHNQADVTFAQGMIPHHQQAVEMSGLAESRAADPQVKALATKIKSAQAPEIQQMTAWLSQWGAPTGSSTAAGHEAHGGSDGIPGMMTGQDMADLGRASGNEFDRMFLEMMIRHHQGAVQMATTEREQGQDPAAKRLAEQIVADQTTEIGQMQDLLKGR